MAGILASNETRIALNLLLAVLFGGLVGLEREHDRRPAGLRTHILICVGAMLFGTIAVLYFPHSDDVSRLWQNIITGVGFLGAGAVFKEEGTVRGLTTAAGIWTTAAIGLTLAAQLYVLAVTAELIVLFTLFLIRRMERRAEAQQDNRAPTDTQRNE